ncbi:MAG TPA: glucosaminidase domain-containing protein [Oscillospiraceae bacterium]|nr:glucosaminidase domain-containing protein [Oscillospiraceae bacterium]
MTPQEFLNKIIPLAVKDSENTKIPASLTIAQAILESGWGKSSLTQKYNNLFGIKGKGVKCATFEYISGKKIDCTGEFKAYPDWESSVADHSSLFLRLARYKNLVGCQDYKTACRNVQADGYATAPDYADMLIRIIEQYELYRYDGKNKKNQVKTYTVKRGDSWWKIAEEQLGDGKRYAELAKFNGTSYTCVIYPGQIIKLPL